MFGEAVEHIVPHVVQIAFHIWAKIIFYLLAEQENQFSKLEILPLMIISMNTI